MRTVSQLMATFAQGNNIKFMTRIVAVGVMVIFGGFATLTAKTFADFGYRALANSPAKHVVCATRIWVPIVPCFRSVAVLFPIYFVAIAPLVIVSILLMPLQASGFDFGPAAILPVSDFFALLTLVAITISKVLVRREVSQWLVESAAKATFCGHKNASCQHGVSACV